VSGHSQPVSNRGLYRLGCAAALVAAGLAWGLLGSDDARTIASFTAAWLFFAGAASGAVAVSALLELTGAGWAGPMHEVTGRLTRYLPVAAVLLVMVAVLTAETQAMHGGAAVGFIAREIAAGLGLLAFARYAMRGAAGHRRGWVLITYCLVFGVVGSLWSFDFVVLPAPGFSSTLIGPHLFVGAFISGAALTVVGGLLGRTMDQRQRRDAATLLIALAIFWAYLFWSQLLTLWYGHLPEETAFLARRYVYGWQIVTLVVVLTTLAVPFALLLSSWGKRSVPILGIAAGSQLLGLWLERELLVAPAAGGHAASLLTPPVILVEVGMVALFVLSTGPWTARDTTPGTPPPARSSP